MPTQAALRHRLETELVLAAAALPEERRAAIAAALAALRRHEPRSAPHLRLFALLESIFDRGDVLRTRLHLVADAVLGAMNRGAPSDPLIDLLSAAVEAYRALGGPVPIRPVHQARYRGGDCA